MNSKPFSYRCLLLFLLFLATAASAQQAGRIVGWGSQVVGVDLSTGFVAVASGTVHSLALKEDGSIVAWGYNEFKQCIVPSPNSDFVAVSAGESHSLALRADGSIVAWGGNHKGQCSIPSPNNGFVGIATGYYHNLGLKANGSIVAWGYNSYGQCDVPGPSTDFVAVSSGGEHSLGLKPDGSIVAWGRNLEGQCDIPTPNSDFVAVAGGAIHALGLKVDGSIVGWGSNGSDRATPPPSAAFNAIAAGTRNSLAIDASCYHVLAGDLNDDCRADLADHSAIASQWPETYTIFDLAALASNWLVDCSLNPADPACVPK